jgi:hypothetical protein
MSNESEVTVMKTTHGTKAVRDQDNEEHENKQEEHSQDDDSDHNEIEHTYEGNDVAALLGEFKVKGALEPELRLALRDACQESFRHHRSRTYSSWEELEKDIIERLGGSLQFYWQHVNHSPNVDAIVFNFLTRMKKEEGSIQ